MLNNKTIIGKIITNNNNLFLELFHLSTLHLYLQIICVFKTLTKYTLLRISFNINIY